MAAADDEIFAWSLIAAGFAVLAGAATPQQLVRAVRAAAEENEAIRTLVFRYSPRRPSP